MDDLTQELEDLLPKSRTLVIRKETITIQPFLFEQLPQLLPKMSALLDLCEAGAGVALLADETRITTFREIFALAAGKPVEWAVGLDAAAGIELAAAVAEVNEGFFQATLRAMPKLAAIVERLRKPQADGVTSPRS